MIRNVNKFLKLSKEVLHPRLSTPLLASFHNSKVLNKKLGIGEASVVLEDKISKISQLVIFLLILTIFICSLFKNALHMLFRTTSKSLVLLFQLVMELPESLVSQKFKQEKWWSSAKEFEAWR